MKLLNNQGFGLIDSVLAVVIVLGLVFIGWQLDRYNNATNTELKASASELSTTNTQAGSTNSIVAAENGVLDIKPWGVKLSVAAPIADATYQIVTNNTYLSPAAFLSTQSLNRSAECTAYYHALNQATNDPQPTFQFIERYALSASIHQLDSSGTTSISASQAATQMPSAYRKIGNYVYFFSQENGSPCKEQSNAQSLAFKAAFQTIQP